MSEGPKHALVIDDDPMVRATIVAMLEGEGWAATEAEDGSDGCGQAQREMPDLIILDLRMPGQDGFDALKELRQDARTENIPVIMLSAINDYEIGEPHTATMIGRKVGVRAPDAFVEKPIDLKKFIRIVSEIT